MERPSPREAVTRPSVRLPRQCAYQRRKLAPPAEPWRRYGRPTTSDGNVYVLPGVTWPGGAPPDACNGVSPTPLARSESTRSGPTDSTSRSSVLPRTSIVSGLEGDTG